MGSILITGASSGLGDGLARHMAARGYDQALAARSEDKLEALRSELLAKHPERRIEIRRLDVTDYDQVPVVLKDLQQAMGGLDIICVNAGIGSGAALGSGQFEHDRRCMETNVIGAMATIDAAAALFREQGHGHIVTIASVAAFRGMPTAAAYCASKAAVSTLMEGLRAELVGTNIRTTTLYPGYIDTPINNHMPNRPFLVDAEKGTRIMADLIEKQVVKSTVPVWPWNLVGRLLRILPVSMLAKMS